LSIIPNDLKIGTGIHIFPA